MKTILTLMSDFAAMESLEQRWRSVLGAGTGLFNLVDSNHPLSIYIGGNSAAEPSLTLVLTNRPPTLAKFSLLSIEIRKRPDGSWLLLLQLQSMTAFREFVTMCGALILASKDATSEEAALKAFLISMDHWRKLFKPATEGLMSEGQLRGLAAELTCMRALLRRARSWGDVIHGWVGPLRAPQDFRLSGNVTVEVKAVHRDSQSVKIASLEQLDSAGSEKYLVTVVVDRCVEAQEGSQTVPSIVAAVEKDLIGDFELLDEFRAKLRELEFDPDEQIYGNYHFTVGESRIFQVTEAFPQIRRADVSVDILRVEYELSLSGIAPYLLDTQTII